MFSERGSTTPGPATMKVSARSGMTVLSAARERRETRAIEMAIVKATDVIRRTDFLLSLFIRMLQRKSYPKLCHLNPVRQNRGLQQQFRRNFLLRTLPRDSAVFD